jgi:hypothetical protein
MSLLTVTLASLLIATSAMAATMWFVYLQRCASKRGPAGSVWREVVSERGIGLRLALVSLFYGEWLLVRGVAGSSSAAAWVVTGIRAAIFAWVLWDSGVLLRSSIRRRSRAG